jgi:Flp pilus assembly pilin Flp
MHLVRSLRAKLRRRNKKRSKRGQGVTEYGAMLAFVAILVACVFGISQSALKKGVSGAYSSMATQLNNLSSASGSSSS